MNQYFGDPDSAFDQYDHDQAKAERRRPVCDWCGEAIYDDLYILPDGTKVWRNACRKPNTIQKIM